MHSISAASSPSCCCPYPFHNYSPPRLRFNSKHHFLRFHTYPRRFAVLCSVTLPSSNRERGKHRHNSPPDPSYTHFHRFDSSSDFNYLSNETPESENHKYSYPEQGEAQLESHGTSFSSNMWLADLKAAVGQRINLEGIVSSVAVVAKERHLALPHIAVPDIRYIDWAELQRKGFKGVVFDKDNTITAPYSLTLWGPLGSSLDRCKSVFGNDIAVFSNSAGLREYDHHGSKAEALEKAIGIKVIRHRVKKPAGSAGEIEKHFGCMSSQLIMVGDRPFTDVVFGNRNGFLTILTEPLSVVEEPFIVRQVRKLEYALVNHWSRKGLKPFRHSLLSDTMRCVKEPPPS